VEEESSSIKYSETATAEEWSDPISSLIQSQSQFQSQSQSQFLQIPGPILGPVDSH
jgi:hypothetical protein